MLRNKYESSLLPIVDAIVLIYNKALLFFFVGLGSGFSEGRGESILVFLFTLVHY